MYRNVCLGGTFDGIHAGHKMLFEKALKLCGNRLVVGVTDTNMIKNKVLWELIAPVEDRINSLRGYLTSINGNISYDIVPIQDIYGPTILEEDLQCIVVSKETIKGADKINQARKSKGWHELAVETIDLLEPKDPLDVDAMQQLREKKISSSLLRAEKLGTILRPPSPNNSIPNRPYLIGLTGGIASGKTTISKHLVERHGFGCINYDIMGHRTYSEIGSPIYNQVVSFFGNEILNQDTSAIERAKLGKIVFSDKSKLDKLNEIVWPGIYRLVDEEIDQLKDKHEVIVLESALLIESGQLSRVHQIWTCFIPPDEAVRRQMESRNLSKPEAEKRVMAQIDNTTRIKASNAVFCSLWDEDFTRRQVDRCVGELKKYLN